MKFGTDIYGPQRINPRNFGDSLTFPLGPTEGQSFHFIMWNISTFILDELAKQSTLAPP